MDNSPTPKKQKKSNEYEDNQNIYSSDKLTLRKGDNLNNDEENKLTDDDSSHI